MGSAIDLHIHTTISDGAYSPKEVIDMAKQNNVTTIAISDHDTIEAYTNEVREYSKDNGITLINAVEISTKFNKHGIHVLGYNFDLDNKELKDALYKNRNARHIYLKKVCDKLNAIGYKVNYEELDKIKSVTKSHISLDVINNEQNKEKLIKDFGHIPNKGEFIEIIMNENCPAYVKKNTLTPKEASEIIKNANGKVVLAHPVAYSYEDGLSENDIQEIIDTMLIDGIEANYIYVDRNNEIRDECIRWNKFADKNNLFVTIGSDFHNKDGIRPEIGLINTSLKLSAGEVNNIKCNI